MRKLITTHRAQNIGYEKKRRGRVKGGGEGARIGIVEALSDNEQ